MRGKSKFLSFTEFKERFDIKPNFLAFYGVVSSTKTLRNMVNPLNTKLSPKNTVFNRLVRFFSCHDAK